MVLALEEVENGSHPNSIDSEVSESRLVITGKSGSVIRCTASKLAEMSAQQIEPLAGIGSYVVELVGDERLSVDGTLQRGIRCELHQL